MSPEQQAALVTQVPGTQVHADLAEFVDWLLHSERERQGRPPQADSSYPRMTPQWPGCDLRSSSCWMAITVVPWALVVLAMSLFVRTTASTGPVPAGCAWPSGVRG
jgi:hypothetical protein